MPSYVVQWAVPSVSNIMDLSLTDVYSSVLYAVQNYSNLFPVWFNIGKEQIQVFLIAVCIVGLLKRPTVHRLRGLRGQGIPQPEPLREVTDNAQLKDKNTHRDAIIQR